MRSDVLVALIEKLALAVAANFQPGAFHSSVLVILPPMIIPAFCFSNYRQHFTTIVEHPLSDTPLSYNLR